MTTHSMHRIGRSQRGQAAVEFIVSAMFFLIPLFLAVAALGKFADVQHTADMAARYGAWERTVWYDQSGTDFNAINAPNQKSAAAIKGEIAARLFSDRSSDVTVIRSTDQTNTSLVNGIDPMWQDAAGTAFLQQYDRYEAAAGRESPTRDTAGAIVDAARVVEVRGLVGFVPPLPTDTMAVSTVTLTDVARESEVYQRLWNLTGAWEGLDFAATGAILSNTWGANANGGTRDMVARTVPTAQGLGAVVTAARVGIAPWQPQVSNAMEVGKINVDVVPSDRLR